MEVIKIKLQIFYSYSWSCIRFPDPDRDTALGWMKKQKRMDNYVKSSYRSK